MGIPAIFPQKSRWPLVVSICSCSHHMFIHVHTYIYICIYFLPLINTETLRIQLIVQGTCWWVFQRLQIQSTHSRDFHHVPKTNAGLRNQAVTWKTWNNDQTQCWWNMVKPPMELREPFSIHMQMVLCTSHENCLWIQNNPILQLDCFNPGDLPEVVKFKNNPWNLTSLSEFYHPSMKFYHSSMKL